MARANLKKSGKNKFAGFEYFELGDFLPKAHELMDAVGICGVFSIGPEFTSLTVFDVDPSGGAIQFTSPTVMAENAKGQPIQSLGSTHTYMRRYMWLIALELSEHDEVDAVAGSTPPAKPKPETKTVVAELPKTAPAEMSGVEGPWMLKITTDPGADIDNWVELLLEATKLALEIAKSKSDVMSIFKVNQNIFSTLKSVNQTKWDELMAIFKQHKESKA
jgi:hypothetical protein